MAVSKGRKPASAAASVPPHNLEAEESVLGAAMMAKTAAATLLQELSHQDFYKPAHQDVYRAIRTLRDREVTIDPVTVAAELKQMPAPAMSGFANALEAAGGHSYLHTLISGTPTAGAAPHYARLVSEQALLRRMADAGHEISYLAYSRPDDVEGAAESAQALLTKATSGIPGGGSPLALEPWGLGWRSSIGPYSIRASQVTESRGAIWAEIDVWRGNRRLHRDVHLNLAAAGNESSGRKGFAKKLTERAPEFRDSWLDVMDWLADAVIDASRAPTPFIDLGQHVPEDSKPAMLVSPILPYRQPTMLWADGGSGKSIIALAIGLLVATGLDLPGLSLAKPRGPVLYLDFEWSADPHSRRLTSLCRGMGLGDRPPKDQFIYHKMHRPFLDEFEPLQQFVSERGIRLVVFDSLWGAARDMYDQSEVGVFMRGANALQTSVLILNHVTKEVALNGGPASGRGPRAWNDACRAAWRVEPVEDKARGLLSVSLWQTKANEGEQSRRPVRWQITFVEKLPFLIEQWDGVADEPDDQAQADRDSRTTIAEHLANHGQATIKEIVLATSLNNGTVRVTLNRMLKDNEVIRYGKENQGGVRWSLRD